MRRLEWLNVESLDDKLTLRLKFTDGDRYIIDELTIENFIGDTPEEFADSLDHWSAYLRGKWSLATASDSEPIGDRLVEDMVTENNHPVSKSSTISH